MAKAPRPGVNRKTEQIDRAEKFHVRITVDGTMHEFWPTEMSALDVVEMRRQAGMGVQEFIRAMTTDPDVPEFAVVIWQSRRQNGEPRLRFEEVAAGLTTDDLIVALAGMADAAEDQDDSSNAEADRTGEA
jgi:hypothetical protein